MLIAQISDLHISGRGKKTCNFAPMAENLTRCIDHINQLNPAPDVVLVTGDIANDALVEETEHAAELLGRLRNPYFVIPGNHDDRSILWSVFRGKACPARHQGFINYVIDGYDIRLIALDTTVPGAPHGEVCETRAEWLEERLSEAPDKPTVIFMHHPPVKCGVAETDIELFQGAERLGGVIRNHPNIERMICGHIHLPAHSRWSGSIVSTAPSMGMKLVLDLTMKQLSGFFLDAPGYQLHYWSTDKALVTHTVYVRTEDGPHPFDPRADGIVTPGT